MMRALSIGGSPVPLVEGFPAPGRLVRLAYREVISLRAHKIGTLRPSANSRSCRDRGIRQPAPPHLRKKVWSWLDAVVTWLNVEYVSDVADAVPGCWPLHPHLVHEFAVLADQRRRAGQALTSDALEKWHRYSLPAFVERLWHGCGATTRTTISQSSTPPDQRALRCRCQAIGRQSLADRSTDPSAKRAFRGRKSGADQGCYWWAILDLNQ
jgi:hypothetical protein